MLDYFACFYFVICRFSFSTSTFSKISFRNSIRVSLSVDTDQARLRWDPIWVQAVCKDYQRMTKGFIDFENTVDPDQLASEGAI